MLKSQDVRCFAFPAVGIQELGVESLLQSGFDGCYCSFGWEVVWLPQKRHLGSLEGLIL